MKFIKKSTMLVLAMGMLLFACNPDNVAPTEGGNGNPSLAGAASDPHPVLDTICQTADTMFLVREDNGSAYIDKCYGPAGPRPCNTTESAMRWGYLNMLEGYLNDTGYIDCNFTMAPGWFCDQNNWEFSIASAFQFDQNGIPLVTNDWSSNIVAPAANRWQLRIATTVLPDPCYAVALRVGAIKLNLFGAVVAGSQTTLWGKNRNWNVPSHPANSPSPWLQSLCPLRCLDGPEEPEMDTTRICEVVYTGLTCTGNTLNSTVLHPTTTETGVITYAWSNGATTQNLTVSPTVTTNYTVVISVDGVPTHVVIFTVNVIDVSCTITQGGGGNGGGGNGGSGSGNGGSGSGNGGSGSGNGGSGSGNGGSGSGHGGSGSGGSGSGSGNGGNGGQICGNGDQVTASTGATNAPKVLGAPNNQGASFTNTGNTVTIKLKHTLPAGTQYQILWKKSGAGTASLRVFESASNTSYAPNGAAFTTTSTAYVTKTLTTVGATRYIRLESTSSVDFLVDAVTYCYTPPVVTVSGVKVCHVPPGNPGGATTICVPYSQLSQHVTGVCPTTNGGGGNGWGGSGSGSGNGSGNGGSGSGSGGGNGHGCGGHTNNCNGHHQGGNCNNGHSGSGSGGSGSGHGSGQGSGSGGQGSGSNAHGHGSNHGGGCQGNQGGGHTGDYIGACNSNPCLH